MNWRDYIHSDTDILAGKPVIKGTRLSVVFILELLVAGWSEQQITENYPLIKSDHIKAVFAFASECLKDDNFIELSVMEQ